MEFFCSGKVLGGRIGNLDFYALCDRGQGVVRIISLNDISKSIAINAHDGVIETEEPMTSWDSGAGEVQFNVPGLGCTGKMTIGAKPSVQITVQGQTHDLL